MNDTQKATPGPNSGANAAAPARAQPAGGFRRDLLQRYFRQFVFPLWRQIIWALVLTAGLAAVTGAYPLIIKYSFDTILSGTDGVLHIVLIAVIM